MDFPTALDLAKRRFSSHPFWAGFTGTPLANDVPVIAAELMRDAAKSAFREAAEMATGHADAYEKLLRDGLADEGLAMKAAEARTLAARLFAHAF